MKKNQSSNSLKKNN